MILVISDMDIGNETTIHVHTLGGDVGTRAWQLITPFGQAKVHLDAVVVLDKDFLNVALRRTLGGDD